MFRSFVSFRPFGLVDDLGHMGQLGHLVFSHIPGHFGNGAIWPLRSVGLFGTFGVFQRSRQFQSWGHFDPKDDLGNPNHFGDSGHCGRFSRFGRLSHLGNWGHFGDFCDFDNLNHLIHLGQFGYLRPVGYCGDLVHLGDFVHLEHLRHFRYLCYLIVFLGELYLGGVYSGRVNVGKAYLLEGHGCALLM